jgi:hypothetical protein
MVKNCSTCDYWKTYIQSDYRCACIGLSSGPNPGSQLYTSFDDKCKLWTKRPSFDAFRKSIKIKRSMLDD